MSKVTCFPEEVPKAQRFSRLEFLLPCVQFSYMDFLVISHSHLLFLLCGLGLRLCPSPLSPIHYSTCGIKTPLSLPSSIMPSIKPLRLFIRLKETLSLDSFCSQPQDPAFSPHPEAINTTKVFLMYNGGAGIKKTKKQLIPQ